VAYILEREDSQISFWYADAQEFERQLQNDKITHLLIPSGGVSAEVTKRIEQLINDGYLSLVLEDKGSTVTLYKLYAVRH
jgi:hypothetical protein